MNIKSFIYNIKNFREGFLLTFLIWGVSVSNQAQNGPTCTTYTNKTTADGLVQNYTGKVYAVGSTIYATSLMGLNVSTNGGVSFTTRTTADGLGDNQVYDVYAVGSTVYAATDYGLGISTDGGTNFTNITTDLGSSNLISVYAVGNTIYVGTFGGLSISTNGGANFTTRTTANGLADDQINDVYAVGSAVYAATSSGLSISTNGGGFFSNRTTTNGLGNNNVLAVFAIGSTVYAGTSNGLSISTDGGASFTNYHINGTSNDFVYDVYAIGSTVYVAAPNAGLGISTNGGTTFTVYNTSNGIGDNFVNGVFATNSTIYAATDNGLSICSTVLPIELLSFIGKNTEGGNLLTWTTADEVNNKGFQVERRQVAGDSWAVLGFKTANHKAGTYEFTDNTPLSTSYYRLRQIDNDGKETLSKVISVSQKGNSKLITYPNPVSNVLTVEYTEGGNFQVFNLLGQQVMNGKSAQRIDVSALPEGTYFLKVGVEQVKFVKQ